MSVSNLPFFLLGLGVGAALGIAFAPESGESLRLDIRSRARDGRDYMRRRGSELRDQADEILVKGRQGVQSQRNQLTAALEAGRRAYRDATAEPGDAASAGA